MHGDEEYLRYCTERKPFVRQVFEKDIILPHEGRYLAKELGIPYYETSVYTFFGVEELFENAARAALCSRRTKRFWKTNLKNVSKPLMQEPFCPPKPSLPEESVCVSSLHDDLTKLYNDARNTDVIFVCSDSRGVAAHKFILAATCPLLCNLFSLDITSGSGTSHLAKSESFDSLLHVKFGSSTVCPSINSSYNLQSFVAPDSTLKEHTKSLYRQSMTSSSSGGCMGLGVRPDKVVLGPGIFRQLSHPVFTSLHLQQCITEDDGGQVSSSLQTVLSCRKIVTLGALQSVLRYLYTGTISLDFGDLQRVLHLAELLELETLCRHLTEIPHLGNIHQVITSSQVIGQQLEKASRDDEGFFTDVTFQLDDGVMPSHKAMLSARSDVMAAMFSDNFIEGTASLVSMPGVQKFAFCCVQHYLYTDVTPHVTVDTCLMVLELANRLVLPRLINLIESSVILEMKIQLQNGEDVHLEALELLQPSQMYNATQLSQWCFAYIGHNYMEIYQKFPKIMKSLSPDNQAMLNLSRWPPIWYIKDFEIYERFVESMATEKERTSLTRKRRRYQSLVV